MFYIPSSTEIFGGVSTYASSSWQNFYPLIALIVGVVIGVLVVALVVRLLIGGAKKLAGGRRRGRGRRRH